MYCGLGKAQQDMLFCGVMAALGATVSWVRKLVMPFHKEKIARYGAALANYQKEMQAWISESKNREEGTTTPQERFLGELPMSFTRQQSLAIGEKFGFTAKQMEYFKKFMHIEVASTSPLHHLSRKRQYLKK